MTCYVAVLHTLAKETRNRAARTLPSESDIVPVIYTLVAS